MPASTSKCLVESDLLDSKRKCTITASTLEEFMEALLSSLQMSIPREQLSFLVYDKDFEDFVGEWLFGGRFASTDVLLLQLWIIFSSSPQRRRSRSSAGTRKEGLTQEKIRGGLAKWGCRCLWTPNALDPRRSRTMQQNLQHWDGRVATRRWLRDDLDRHPPQ
jgi:hypothetical protein